MNFIKFLLILVVCVVCVQSTKQLKNDYSKNAIKRHIGQKTAINPEKISYLQTKRTKRQILPVALTDFEKQVLRTKAVCARKLGVTVGNELFMSKPYHTDKEKCLLECILKNTGLMDASNRLNTNKIAHLANRASENNALVSSIAVALAKNCNKRIRTNNPCEAASQLTQCVANELRQHSIILSI